MSRRFTLRATAALFVVAGLFLLRLATLDPASLAAAERVRGSLERVEFRATPKHGEWCVVTLTSSPTTYELQEPLASDPALRAELATRLVPGVDVELECPPEPGGDRRPRAGEEPRRIRRLSANGTLVFDVQTRRGQGHVLLHLALGLAALLAIGGGVRMFVLAGRVGKSRRIA